MMPGECQKLPGECQKLPGECQKLPGECQKLHRAEGTLFRVRWSLPWVAAMCAVLAFSPLPATADDTAPPEAYLSADAAGYFRFDGIDGTAAQLGQTTFGKLLQTDLKPLADYLYDELVDLLGPGFLSEQLLGGSQPDTLLELQQAAEAFPLLLQRLKSQGVVASFEVINPIKPRLQLSLILPNVKDDADAQVLMSGFRLLGLMSDGILVDTELEGRKIQGFTLEGVNFACWREGAHVIATIGTETPEHTLGVVKGERPNLAASPLYQRLQAAGDYATCARGFVNARSVTGVLAKAFAPSSLVVEALGLNSLEHVAFWYGFEGPYQRLRMELESPGERRGIMRMLSAPGTISLADLPALPPDATMVYTTRIDFPGLYNDTIEAASSITKLAFPFDPPNIEDAVEGFNRLLGVNVRQELIESLGDRVISYDSPNQGPFMTGTTLAIEVKNEERLLKALSNLVAAGAAASGEAFHLRTVVYRGVPLHVIDVRDRGFIFQPAFCIHQGWLVVSLFPQPVQGFVLRNGPDAFARWQPPAALQQALQAAEKTNARLIGFSAADPRPGINQLMSMVPMLLGATRQFSEDESANFDLTLLPPAQAITEHVMPGAGVTTDDGRTIRIDYRSSLPLPMGVTGFDVQGFFLLTFALRF